MPSAVTPGELEDDAPVPLRLAPGLFWPMGGMTLSKLRAQAREGRLVIERIGRTEFVTRKAIEEMRARCRDENCRQGSPSERRTASAPGSSVTANAITEQDALRLKLSKPQKPSTNGLRKGSGPTRQNVVPLKSSLQPS